MIQTPGITLTSALSGLVAWWLDAASALIKSSENKIAIIHRRIGQPLDNASRRPKWSID